MMRASRPATAPIMPATAVSKNTGATDNWMLWVMLEESMDKGIRDGVSRWMGHLAQAGVWIIGAACPRRWRTIAR